MAILRGAWFHAGFMPVSWPVSRIRASLGPGYETGHETGMKPSLVMKPGRVRLGDVRRFLLRQFWTVFGFTPVHAGFMASFKDRGEFGSRA